MNQQKRAKFKSQHNREYRWVISYADFLTLLFAFFVFFFLISTLQNEKFQEVSSTLLQIFDVRPSSVDPIELNATPQGPDMFNPLFKPEPLPGTQIDLSNTEIYATESSLLDIQHQLGQSFSQLIDDQLFSVSGDESWIEIQIADSVTFFPGSADITNRAEAVLYEVGKLLASSNVPVAIEGYSLENEGTLQQDGWALSSARAINVLRYLQRAGVGGQRLSAVSFSHFQPRTIDPGQVSQGKISIVAAGFGQQVSTR